MKGLSYRTWDWTG